MLLLCSDGLSGKLRADDIQQIVVNSQNDLAKACDALIDEANNRGGEDNITVVLARFPATTWKNQQRIESRSNYHHSKKTKPSTTTTRPTPNLTNSTPVFSPLGFATDPAHIDRRAFDALHTNTFACFQRRFTCRGICGPGGTKNFHRAFVQRALARGNDRADLSRQRVDAAA